MSLDLDFVSVFQTLRCGGDHIFATIQAFNQNASAALRKHSHVALHRLAVKGDQYKFLAAGVMQASAGNECSSRLSAYALVFVRQKMDGGIHLRAQM